MCIPLLVLGHTLNCPPNLLGTSKATDVTRGQRTQTGLRDVWKVMERLVTEKVDLMYLQHSCSTWYLHLFTEPSQPSGEASPLASPWCHMNSKLHSLRAILWTVLFHQSPCLGVLPIHGLGEG